MLAVAVIPLVAGTGCSRATEPAPLPALPAEPAARVEADVDAAPPPPPTLPDVAEAGCLEGWRGLDASTCWLGAPDATALLVYLSGIVPPLPRSPQKETVARVVAAAATRAHVAAILPRGRRGIGPADVKDWWAWPTSVADADRLGPELVEEWRSARTKLESTFGYRFRRTYLAGSSSGAYFLALLALRPGRAALDELDVRGFAAASGGAPVPGASGTKRPFYVGHATGDPTSGGAKALAAQLRSAGWPVREAEHPGGHGAREVYLDEAFAFWEHADAGRSAAAPP